jgi:uncharacterized protein
LIFAVLIFFKKYFRLSNIANLFFQSGITTFQWVLIMFGAIIIGMSKSGIGSISIISVSIYAWVFGSRASSGFVLPMLIIADIIAVYYYKRHALWPHLVKLLPWIIGGVLLAVICGKYIDDIVFKKLMAFIILISVAALFWWEKRPVTHAPSHWLFGASMGVGTGFTSMIGNLASGFSNMYFISMKVNKDNFIGTAAWMFFILNLFKLPFHIWVWHTIVFSNLIINISLIPMIAFGFFAGAKMVDKLNDDKFRKLIMWLTLISALVVLFDLR